MIERYIPLQDISQGQINPKEHYERAVGPIEFEDLSECEYEIKNIGWTLGNECPYRCKHCYSMSAREKGMDLDSQIVDRVISQLVLNGIETVNLGGNEPLFTNGANPKNTMLPYIIDKLTDNSITVGLTTSGITLIHLERDHNESFRKLNDVDVSLDSPFEEEHNNNRGAKLYKQALRALELCEQYGIDHTIIMCAMNWNFSEPHILELVNLARRYNANIRINPLKPVEPQHMETALSAEAYYKGFELLMNLNDQIDLGEPPLATVCNHDRAQGCPCGRTSFRIHSITPDGKIPVSPCVYLHDYKVGNLIEDELSDIVESPQFKSFRRRNRNSDKIVGCQDCPLRESCRGGCAARSYLHNAHETGERTLFVKDPYCPLEENPDHSKFPQNPSINNEITLVHKDYLCTWIGKPKAQASQGGIE